MGGKLTEILFLTLFLLSLPKTNWKNCEMVAVWNQTWFSQIRLVRDLRCIIFSVQCGEGGLEGKYWNRFRTLTDSSSPMSSPGSHWGPRQLEGPKPSGQSQVVSPRLMSGGPCPQLLWGLSNGLKTGLEPVTELISKFSNRCRKNVSAGKISAQSNLIN